MNKAQEIIESLEFYGTGDEAVELFRETCHLAYSMTSLGQDDKAIVLAMWAKEMASESKGWYYSEIIDEGDTDMEKGVWG